jgi:hypothetical protein
MANVQKQADDLRDALREATGEHSTAALLRGVDATTKASVHTMATIVDRLEGRRRDVEELISITRTAAELEKKIQRLAQRLLKEEETT